MYEKIPFLLTSIPQWVATKNNTKVPFNAIADAPASSTNPDTWCDFDSAKSAVENGKYDGIGFVFNDNGIVGIDIDCGFEEGGAITPTALDIIMTCVSYTELSRSGRGVHIFLKGKLPFKGKNNLNGVEIYQDGRYFITTGKQVFFSEIKENQEAIDYVVDRYFPAIEVEDYEIGERIYSPIFAKPDKVLRLRPTYPPIGEGGRHLSLVSLAGQLHSNGWSKKEIYSELCFANHKACDPPLPDRELRQITNSVTRYDR